METDILLIIPVSLIAAALVILLLTRRKRETLNMPQGTTIYQDTQEQRGTILYAHQYKLKGRPDFLLNQSGVIIPVEAKTGSTPRRPIIAT